MDAPAEATIVLDSINLTVDDFDYSSSRIACVQALDQMRDPNVSQPETKCDNLICYPRIDKTVPLFSPEQM